MERFLDFKILTLNCWGVKFFSRDKKRRIEQISNALCETDCEIICLQEIWCQEDFNYLQKRLSEGRLVYSHYFYSKLIGSGCCIFSCWPILETFFHTFSLNGYAYTFYHGDYYGGKGVGLAKIRTSNGFYLNVYVTHLIADYGSELNLEDIYLSHRVSQALEMGQFITLTGGGCDALIACGDFNTFASSCAYKLLTQLACLNDAYLNQPNVPEAPDQTGATCRRRDSIYAHKKYLEAHPFGQRIDYIFYANAQGSRISCQQSDICLYKVPNQANLEYSDHTGVTASFHLVGDIMQERPRVDLQRAEVRHTMEEARNTLLEGIQRSDKTYHRAFLGFMLFLTLLLTLSYLPRLNPGHLFADWVPAITTLVVALLACLVFVLFWQTFVVFRCERRALLNSLGNLKHYLARD